MIFDQTRRSIGTSDRSTGLTGSDAISNAIEYAKFRSRSYNAVIRVYDDAGNVIETHEHEGGFKEP